MSNLSTTPAREPFLPHVLALGLTCVPMFALCQFMAYFRTDIVDDQMFAYYGWRIAHGATVYLDVWDNKPPGIYWINALAMGLSGGDYLGVIAICTLALVVSHVAFFIICRSCFHIETATIATILLSFFVTHGYYTGGTNRTETFLTACELAAVAFYVRGFAADRWWKWYVAGVLCGAAFLFKQVGLVAWGAMGLHLIFLMSSRILPVRDGVRRGALLVGGAATAIGAAVAVLAAQGALGEALFATFGFNRAYFAVQSSRFPYNYVNWFLLRNHTMPVLLMPILLAIAGSIHAAVWWLRPHFRPREILDRVQQRNVCPGYMFLFAVWFVVAFYGALISPHAFRHYLVPSIPPLLLLGAHLINAIKTELSLIQRIGQRAWTAAAFVAMGYFAAEAVRLQWEEVSKIWVFRFEQGERAHWEEIGDVIRRASEPEDRIYCFGYFPGVYLQAKRIAACRYTTTEKIGQVEEQADFIARELQNALRTTPPAMIVITAGDYEWMHGRLPDKPPSRLRLASWIDDNYTRIADLSLYTAVYVYKRNDLLRRGDFTFGIPPPE